METMAAAHAVGLEAEHFALDHVVAEQHHQPVHRTHEADRRGCPSASAWESAGPSRASLTISGSSVGGRARRACSLRCTKRSPLASVSVLQLRRRRCRSSAAKPSSAGVGLPSASSAMLSVRAEHFAVLRRAARMATRRQQHGQAARRVQRLARRRDRRRCRACPGRRRRRRRRPAPAPAAPWAAVLRCRVRSAGLHVVMAMRGSVLVRLQARETEFLALRVIGLGAPRATACARAGCSAGVRSPRSRGAHRAG